MQSILFEWSSHHITLMVSNLSFQWIYYILHEAYICGYTYSIYICIQQWKYSFLPYYVTIQVTLQPIHAPEEYSVSSLSVALYACELRSKGCHEVLYHLPSHGFLKCSFRVHHSIDLEMIFKSIEDELTFVLCNEN